jgi:hypothetical protein
MLAELRGTAGGKKGETFRQIETIIANMERSFRNCNICVTDWLCEVG